ncbi:anti-sigma factor [Galbitalea soli]|uniref:Regulator of SigK n=1 Tax=Galbitalea soli TaxID=1268042 RepID=A0A7C9TRN1_9MICO|nr:anti-sigma factor [Galbitalea soli]NEM92316.1 hypothetical protein [Galbitalea soli]NYJ31728.1 anti-sigma-K factor RskA [Galbitalea soli]
MTDRKKASAPDSGAYVLNSLNGEEANDFETQLAESEELRSEVTELTDTAVLLGLAVEPVTPSPELKAGLMARIATTPQLPREVAPVRTLHAVPPIAADQTAADDLSTAPDAPTSLAATVRRRWYTRPMVALTSAAAAVALILGGGVLVNTLHDNGVQSTQASAMSAIYSASDMKRVIAPVTTGGTATLVYSHSVGKAALILDGVPTLPSGKAYELWYIDAKGTPTAAGIIPTSTKSTYRVLDGTLTPGATIGVTVEPASGSTKPTTSPVVAIASA